MSPEPSVSKRLNASRISSISSSVRPGRSKALRRIGDFYPANFYYCFDIWNIWNYYYINIIEREFIYCNNSEWPSMCLIVRLCHSLQLKWGYMALFILFIHVLAVLRVLLLPYVALIEVIWPLGRRLLSLLLSWKMVSRKWWLRRLGWLRWSHCIGSLSKDVW